jgi:polar amino acid transport system ATP-binding protein
METVVKLSKVEKSYGALPVLRGIDLEIGRGEVVSVIGPSGSGKSTLLRLLMTLDRPEAGRIEIDGEPLWTAADRDGRVADRARMRRIRGKIGMVFQHFNLFPHMNVLRNVTEAPLRVLKVPAAEAEARGREYLQMVGLADKVDAWPAQPSGGQKQRVAIARALAMRPTIMLFDEITSALDPELVGGILELLRELSQTRSMTMIIVTHQMRFAEECSDRVLFFDRGVILEEGRPKVIFHEPREERTREFLKSILEAGS